jgi:hypothetical protein
VDAAMPTEKMLGDLLVELIEGQFFLPLQQLKVLGIDITP